MSRVVFDIETLGLPFESFDGKQQEYLLKFAKTEEERVEAVQKLNLTPLTARVLAIAMLNPDTGVGKVYYQGPGDRREASADGMLEFVPLDEPALLGEFWKAVALYDQVITFNGRAFDGPFLMIRSAMLGVKPTRNLVPYRYESRNHCDLLDQMSFYGATRKFNLDFVCKSFGIRSPKEKGITGLDMRELYEARRYREIAEYCMDDVRATAELYKRWKEFLWFKE
jgi:DNA polymerase elongation subunit (family B)